MVCLTKFIGKKLVAKKHAEEQMEPGTPPMPTAMECTGVRNAARRLATSYVYDVTYFSVDRKE